MKINKYLTITNNIELITLPKEEKFHIFIGKIPNRFWFSIKIFKTSNEVKYADNLVNPDNGDIFKGNYVERNIYTYSLAKYSCFKLPRFHKYLIKTRMPV